MQILVTLIVYFLALIVTLHQVAAAPVMLFKRCPPGTQPAPTQSQAYRPAPNSFGVPDFSCVVVPALPAIPAAPVPAAPQVLPVASPTPPAPAALPVLPAATLPGLPTLPILPALDPFAGLTLGELPGLPTLPQLPGLGGD